MTDLTVTLKDSILILKSKDKSLYLYFLVSLGLIYLLFYPVINATVIEWFADGNYITKGPFFWVMAFALAFLSLDKASLLQKTSSLNDLFFLVFIIAAVVLAKGADSTIIIVPTLLFSAITFYATRIQKLPEIIIVWLFLLFTLNYFPLLTPYLVSMSVWANEGLLALFGIPILVQENFIAIPRGQFEVEGSCSGFRYLANNLILFFLYALMSRFNLRQFFLALALTVLYSLLINWIRITIIIVVAHNWGFEVPFFVKDHGDLGWVIYVIFLVLFFYTLIKIDRMKFSPSRIMNYGERVIAGIPRVWLLLPLFIFAKI